MAPGLRAPLPLHFPLCYRQAGPSHTGAKTGAGSSWLTSHPLENARIGSYQIGWATCPSVTQSRFPGAGTS